MVVSYKIRGDCTETTCIMKWMDNNDTMEHEREIKSKRKKIII